MDQSVLVGNQVDDGRRVVQRFAADGHIVRAAFWVKTAEEGLWFLYVVTDEIDNLGPAAAYREIYASLQKLEDCTVSLSEIKLLSPNNPMAKDVLADTARHPGTKGARFGEKLLGRTAVEAGYLYPTKIFTFPRQANPMTAEDIGRQIVRLMSRGPGALQPSQVALKDGTFFTGVPFSIQLGSQQTAVVQFIVDDEHAPRVIPLDEIGSIT